MDATSATLIAINATGTCGDIEGARPGPGGGQSAGATAGVLVSSLSRSRMVNLAIDVYRTHLAVPQGCGCGRLESVDGRRCYRSPCGCRMNLVEAAIAERLTYEALDNRGLGPAEGVPESAWGALFARELAYVRVGAAPEDLVLVRRA